MRWLILVPVLLACGLTLTADERIDGLLKEICELRETVEILRGQVAIKNNELTWCLGEFWNYQQQYGPRDHVRIEWQRCLTGPLVPAYESCCDKDYDQDGDVDMSDFGIWQVQKGTP